MAEFMLYVRTVLFGLTFALVMLSVPQRLSGRVLQFDRFAHYIERFNAEDVETITNYIPNSVAKHWLSENIPLFECPDREVEEIYYYRFWVYRKHIKLTPVGFVITEFLKPVKHAGQYNTISCAVGHHLAEGRWLWNQQYLRDYILFWLRGYNGGPQPHFHQYSSWFAWAVYQWYMVTDEKSFVTNLVDDLVADYNRWCEERELPEGLFWQYDVRDGMEESISGSRTNKNIRPTINAYMYGNAMAIAALARLAGRQSLVVEFENKANALRQRMLLKLWDSQAEFFKVRLENGELSDVRELIGYVPWMFGLAPVDEPYMRAWKELTNFHGFKSAFGFTTAEQRHIRFRTHGVGRCEWDGPIWPFATSQTLSALANVLRAKPETQISICDYFDAFIQYVQMHRHYGKPFIGEYLDEITGAWINRGDRSWHYNHSTFADLVISGLIGIVPTENEVMQLHPLVPEHVWDWFCLDNLNYKGRQVSIVWDRDGSKYKIRPGLTVIVGDKIVTNVPKLQPIVLPLPPKP